MIHLVLEERKCYSRYRIIRYWREPRARLPTSSPTVVQIHEGQSFDNEGIKFTGNGFLT